MDGLDDGIVLDDDNVGTKLKVGTTDGKVDGTSLGLDDGFKLGDDDGLELGSLLGETEGRPDGALLGTLVGANVPISSQYGSLLYDLGNLT